MCSPPFLSAPQQLPLDQYLEEITWKLSAAAYRNGPVDWRKLATDCERSKGAIDFTSFREFVRSGAQVEPDVVSDMMLEYIFSCAEVENSGAMVPAQFLSWMEQPEQIKRRLRDSTNRGDQVNWQKLFQHSDCNATGVILFDEFRSLVRNFARVSVDVVPDAALENLFSLFSDSDSFSAMNYSEFLNWMDSTDGEQSLQDAGELEQCRTKLAEATYNGQRVNWDKLFQRYDHDTTGMIELSDFRSLIRNYARIALDIVPQTMLERMFSQFAGPGSSPLMRYSDFLAWIQAEGQPSQTSVSSFPDAPKFPLVAAELETILRRITSAARRMGGPDWEMLFDYHSRNNQGLISFKDFRTIVRKDAKITFCMVPETMLLHLFRHVDAVNSGCMNCRKFLALIELVSETHPRLGITDSMTQSFASMQELQDLEVFSSPEASQEACEDPYLKRIKRNLIACAALQGGIDWRRLYNCNNSSTIELGDFHRLLMSDAGIGGASMSANMLKYLFKSLEENNSGCIRYMKFVAWTETALEPGGTPDSLVKAAKASIEDIRRKLLDAAAVQGKVNWRRLFQLHDLDNSGLISFAEFNDLVRKDARVAPSWVSGNDLNRLFRHADASNSGLMNYRAFLEEADFLDGSGVPSFFQSAPSKAPRLKITQLEQVRKRLTAAAYSLGGIDWQKLFRYSDLNNNAVLNFTEFQNLIRKEAQITAQMVSTQRLERLFQSLDADSDGKMDYSEFLVWMENPLAQTLKKKDRQEPMCGSSWPVFRGFALALEQQTGRAVAIGAAPGVYQSNPSKQLSMDGSTKSVSGVAVDSTTASNMDCVNLLLWICFRELNSLHQVPQAKLRKAKPLSPEKKRLKQLRRKLAAAADSQGCIDWQERFENYDCDSRGLIDFSDFRKTVRRDARVTLDMISEEMLEDLYASTDVDHSGRVQYKTILAWLEVEKKAIQAKVSESERQRRAVESAKALKARRAEVAARVRACLGAVTDLANVLVQKTAHCKLQAAQSNADSQAVWSCSAEQRMLLERLENMERLVALQQVRHRVQDNPLRLLVPAASSQEDYGELDDFPIF